MSSTPFPTATGIKATDDDANRRAGTNVAAVAGGTAGGTIAIIMLLLFMIRYYIRRRHLRRRMSVDLVSYMEEPPHEASVISPFTMRSPDPNKYSVSPPGSWLLLHNSCATPSSKVPHDTMMLDLVSKSTHLQADM